MKIDEWREPNPATSADALIRNLSDSLRELADSIVHWLPSISLVAMSLTVIALGILAIRHLREAHSTMMRFGYALVIVLSPIVAVSPIGIAVQFRSLFPVAVGLLALPFLLDSARRTGLVMTLCLLFIGIPSFVHSYQGLSWFASVTQRNVANVKAALPEQLPTFEGAAVDCAGEDVYFGTDLQPHEESYEPFYMEGLFTCKRMAPAFEEVLRVPSVLMCSSLGDVPQSDRCETFVGRMADETRCREGEAICYLGVLDGRLVFRLHGSGGFQARD